MSVQASHAVQADRAVAADRGILAALRSGLVRVVETMISASDAMRCAREVERLQQLSDADLARRGLTRERIVHHAFARYLSY